MIRVQLIFNIPKPRLLTITVVVSGVPFEFTNIEPLVLIDVTAKFVAESFTPTV